MAGRTLLKCTTRAAVFGDASGVAQVGSNGVPSSFKEALAIAAGAAGEKLADLNNPPVVPWPVPLEVAYPEVAEPMRAGIVALMTDDVAIARWCIDGHERKPAMWSIRHDWLCSSALEFVLEHRHEIFETATSLYGRGIITLPVEPAKEQENHAE